MQTIILLFNPEKLSNPDLDLRYIVPERIEEVSNGLIKDNGYDYIDCEKGESLMGIWMETENAAKSWSIISKMIQEEKFLDNDLSLSAEIYISEKETADIDECMMVYPK